jgi:hypothetical protein
VVQQGPCPADDGAGRGGPCTRLSVFVHRVPHECAAQDTAPRPAGGEAGQVENAALRRKVAELPNLVVNLKRERQARRR